MKTSEVTQVLRTYDSNKVFGVVDRSDRNGTVTTHNEPDRICIAPSYDVGLDVNAMNYYLESVRALLDPMLLKFHTDLNAAAFHRLAWATPFRTDHRDPNLLSLGTLGYYDEDVLGIKKSPCEDPDRIVIAFPSVRAYEASGSRILHGEYNDPRVTFETI